jgi:hypothetical protein
MHFVQSFHFKHVSGAAILGLQRGSGQLVTEAQPGTAVALQGVTDGRTAEQPETTGERAGTRTGSSANRK